MMIRHENWIPAMEWILANVDFKSTTERNVYESTLASYKKLRAPSDCYWQGFLYIRGITREQILLFKLTWGG